jgi:predicted lipoprotein with Yx(FWY)xxD motif
VLFTADDRALYMFSFDTIGTKVSPAQSNCTGTCASVWIPFLAPGPTGPFEARGEVQQSQLGTIPRTNPQGPTVYQVTYFGYPLYTFIKDTAPGQTNGENVGAFNGIWHLLTVSGQPNAGDATVGLEDSANGPVLDTPTAFSTHRSLCYLTTDPPRESTCVGGCARIWPPLLTTHKPTAGPGVLAKGLGTLRRPDATLQVTYFGKPLYLFAFDPGAGAPSGLTNGEDLVDSFAFGVWYTVAPSGTPDPGTATVASESSPLGTILGFNSPNPTTPGPFTLYAFSADTQTSSVCNGACAIAWPPLLTSTPPVAAPGSGVTQADLGTILRQDGTFQVTYFGHPLYLFSHGFPGTTGEGITAFGGTFQVVSLAGVPH